MRFHIRCLLSALLACGWAYRADAVDLYGSAPSARSLALGGIFSGSQSGPTDALAVNPAGLSSLGAPMVELSTVGVWGSGTYRNSTAYAGKLEDSARALGSAAFGSRLGQSRISIGLGAFPVSLLSGTWRYLDPAGAAGSASYGISKNRSAFIGIQSTAGVAIDVTKRLAVGFGFGVLYNANALVTPYIFQQNALSGLKTQLDLHTSGLGYNGTVGVLFTANRRLNLGLSYKTKTFVESHGIATGDAGVQFRALGIPFRPSFRYDARVDNTFPQAVSAHAAWQMKSRFKTHLQADWTNWANAFKTLPVRLTNGTNADINSLLQSSSLNDTVPLHWQNQLTWRAGMEYTTTEFLTVLGGYSYTNSPVPSRTLTPMTADIMRNAVSTGLAYSRHRYRVEVGYQANLPSSRSVGKSELLAGEYNNTQTRLFLQTVSVTTGIRF